MPPQTFWILSYSPYLPTKPIVAQAIAVFKTPGLRDLGHSAPYTHSGIPKTLEDVIRDYIESSELARKEELRNGAPQLAHIALLQEDIPH